MILFLILFFIIFSAIIILNLSEKLDKIFYILLGFVLVFIAGLREEGLTKDYENYLNAYYSSGDEASRLEPSFTIISVFVKSAFNNPAFLFLIYALLGVTLKFIAIKQLSRLYLLSGLLYLSNFFLLHEMTQIRVGIASGILLLCIKPLYERNFKTFFCLVFVAISFHYSSIIISLIWFLNPYTIKRYFYLILLPFFYFMALAGFTIGSLIEHIPIAQVQGLYSMYQLKIVNGDGDIINLFNSMQILRCCILLFLIYKIHSISLLNEYAIILVKIYTIALCCFVVFSDIPVVSFRISELLSIVEIVLIPLLIYVFKEKRLAMLFPITIGLFMLLINLFYIKLIL